CAPHQLAQGQRRLLGRHLHARLAALPGQLPRARHGVVEAAQLVDELQLLRLTPGVDASLGDLADFFFGEAAPLGYAWYELAVDVVGEPQHLASILLLQRAEG